MAPSQALNIERLSEKSQSAWPDRPVVTLDAQGPSEPESRERVAGRDTFQLQVPWNRTLLLRSFQNHLPRLGYNPAPLLRLCPGLLCI